MVQLQLNKGRVFNAPIKGTGSFVTLEANPFCTPPVKNGKLVDHNRKGKCLFIYDVLYFMNDETVCVSVIWVKSRREKVLVGSN